MPGNEHETVSCIAKRLPNLARSEPFTVEVDGQAVSAHEGETVATVLLASGLRLFSQTAEDGHPRSLYCGIGLCHQCLVTVDGIRNLRACMTTVRPGMRIETG